MGATGEPFNRCLTVVVVMIIHDNNSNDGNDSHGNDDLVLMIIAMMIIEMMVIVRMVIVMVSEVIVACMHTTINSIQANNYTIPMLGRRISGT